MGSLWGWPEAMVTTILNDPPPQSWISPSKRELPKGGSELLLIHYSLVCQLAPTERGNHQMEEGAELKHLL